MTFRLPEIVYQAFHDERYQGLPENPTYIAKLGSLSQGRVVELGVIVEDDKIIAVGFKAYGDTYCIATFSWICANILAQKMDFLATLSLSHIAKELELPQHKASCALLAEDGLTQLMEMHNVRRK